MTVQDIINHYELKAQSIEALMPEYRKWGSDKYYQHRLTLIQEFVGALKNVDDVAEPIWHDAEDLPESHKQLIMKFCNYPKHALGYYEGNAEDGGNYYIEGISCVSQDLIVDKWAYVPEDDA